VNLIFDYAPISLSLDIMHVRSRLFFLFLVVYYVESNTVEIKSIYLSFGKFQDIFGLFYGFEQNIKLKVSSFNLCTQSFLGYLLLMSICCYTSRIYCNLCFLSNFLDSLRKKFFFNKIYTQLTFTQQSQHTQIEAQMH